jgi:hypothetical protein
MPHRFLASPNATARRRRALAGAAAGLLCGLAAAACAAEMSYDPAQRAILFNGEIQAGDERRFESLLIDHPPTLIIRSGGGQMVPAIAIARQVHERRMTVIVDGYCGSACAQMIFAAAAERRIRPHGFVAFHAGTLPVIEALRSELARRVDGAASASANFTKMSDRANELVRTGRSELERFNAEMGLNPQVAAFYERLTAPRNVEVSVDGETLRSRMDVRQRGICDWWVPDRAGLARLGLDLRNDFEMMPHEEIAKGLQLPVQRFYFGPPLAPDDPALAGLCPEP